jgi:hypothetical protein
MQLEPSPLRRPVVGTAAGISAFLVLVGTAVGLQKDQAARDLQRAPVRLSPASLDLDTCGCPTTFEDPTCAKQTSWSLIKDADMGPLTNPEQEPFSFTVTVTERPTTEVLTAVGHVKVTNSGEQTPTLANVAVLLEDLTPGSGNAPGPSGNNWTVMAVTAENEFPACGNQAVTCDGVFDQSAGANLILYTVGGDPNNQNDIIALSDGFMIPPAVDDDGDGKTGEDPALNSITGIDQNCWGIFDNDGDGLLDEDPGFGIEVGIDDDGDGLIDEDPIDGVDNDGDGVTDEDDPDDDRDGLVDEDGPDDDRDGLIDEDDDCADVTEFMFLATFDVGGLDIDLCMGDGVVPSPDDLRIDLLVTFKGGGKRGGTCALDVDCDGVIEDGSGGTSDQGEGYVRTIQQRHQFDPPDCPWECQCVTLYDPGAYSLDESCAVIDTTTMIDEQICATGVAGTQTIRHVTGTVSCACGDNGQDSPGPAPAPGNKALSSGHDTVCPACQTAITNTAWLTCAENQDLVAGSPWTSSIAINCEGTPGDPTSPQPGDFCSQTQGGWGSECQGNNTGCLRDLFLDSLIATYGPVIVGDPDGADGDGFFAIVLTSSLAVEEYLPAGGTPAPLSADQTDPEVTASGIFGGQLVAATLNVLFDENGLGKCTLTGTCDPCCAPGTLGALVFLEGCVAPSLVGLSVNDVIALANVAIGGGELPPGVTIADLNDALAVVNQEFIDCNSVVGCLEFPWR